MAGIKRRRRVRCKLPCEIVTEGKKRLPGRIVTLSEGGLAVLTGTHFDHGDPIRVVIDPKGAAPIRVSAIVWNDSQAKTSSAETRLRRFGCVVSSPSDSFVSLLERMLPSEPASPKRVARDHTDTVPVPPTKPCNVEGEAFEADLPRSRDLQPPPKVEPEESLPYFRIRVKQIGGPRTRILTVQARSATQAEECAMAELADITSDAAGWAVLHISKVV